MPIQYFADPEHRKPVSQAIREIPYNVAAFFACIFLALWMAVVFIASRIFGEETVDVAQAQPQEPERCGHGFTQREECPHCEALSRAWYGDRM